MSLIFKKEVQQLKQEFVKHREINSQREASKFAEKLKTLPKDEREKEIKQLKSIFQRDVREIVFLEWINYYLQN